MSGIRVRDDHKYIAIWCAGCREIHAWIPISGQDGHTWRWSAEHKTLYPSVRHFHPAHKDDSGATVPEQTLCHYNVTNGRIFYHGDSSNHGLRGDMEMQEIPESVEANWNWGYEGRVEKH